MRNRNLAGVSEADCNFYIRNELERAGINVVECELDCGEVPYRLIGKLNTSYGEFTFTRRWFYWSVDCKVPLELAQKIYAHPEGKASIMAGGHASGEPPEKHVVHIGESGKELVSQEDIDGLVYVFRNSEPSYNDAYWKEKCELGEKSEANAFVKTYHIDDQAGLVLFALMVMDKVK